MELIIWGLVFFGILIPIVIEYSGHIYKEHKKATDGIINYDSTMRRFVYKIKLSKQEIIDLLNTKNDADELSCIFDFEESIITFSEYGSRRNYYYQIQECADFSILRLEQVELFGMQSHVPYKLNPFLVEKLQAQIIPFSQYGISIRP